jgi:sec-independent protein translocase protein TatB
MFNVTGGELFMILLVALIVLGPERLPSAARQVGKVMGQLRDLSEGFKREVAQALDDPSEPIVKPAGRPSLTALDGGAPTDHTSTERDSTERDSTDGDSTDGDSTDGGIRDGPAVAPPPDIPAVLPQPLSAVEAEAAATAEVVSDTTTAVTSTVEGAPTTSTEGAVASTVDGAAPAEQVATTPGGAAPAGSAARDGEPGAGRVPSDPEHESTISDAAGEPGAS